MIIRNSEIMSGKPFELLRSKRLHKHKVLLFPSPHQPRISQLSFSETSLHMEGLASLSSSHPIEILKLWRMLEESAIWLKIRNAVEVKTSSHRPSQLKRILAM